MSMMYTGEESVDSIPDREGGVVYIKVSKSTRPWLLADPLSHDRLLGATEKR